MKILSVILIIAYLMLPAICFGHPCEELSANAGHGALVDNDSGEYPLSHDTDDCETTCCCAGHIPLSTFTEISHAELTAKLLPYKQQLALPRILDRIFVPPQNRS